MPVDWTCFSRKLNDKKGIIYRPLFCLFRIWYDLSHGTANPRVSSRWIDTSQWELVRIDRMLLARWRQCRWQRFAGDTPCRLRCSTPSSHSSSSIWRDTLFDGTDDEECDILWCTIFWNWNKKKRRTLMQTSLLSWCHFILFKFSRFDGILICVVVVNHS